MSDSSSIFLSAMTAGLLFGILMARRNNTRSRDLLLNGIEEENEWNNRDTFEMNELVSKDSISFEELKKKIAQDN